MNGFLSGQPVIAGSGLAGLITALRLSPRPVVLLSAAPLATETSSGWAQGGIAAALGPDDAPALQIADTLAAGDRLCEPEAVRRIVEAGPEAIAALSAFGACFDRAADGTLALGLEAAHRRRRIVHARGDGTGAEVMRALVAAVRATPSITVLEGASLVRVLVEDGAVAGIVIRLRGRLRRLATRQLVIATGGAGGLFLDTTNPLGSTGAGPAIAARAGAALADVEFVQFHPTALAVPQPGQVRGAAPMKLISEAVRGEGASLIDETGARFMEDELAPRDVVSRAVWRHLEAGHSVSLDARAALGAGFATRFPGIAAACRGRGIDPATMPIPIRPAAHYHMGGIAVDEAGRSTLPGLWACGEAACTGLHGANRLASNSLLEAAVCGGLVARSIEATSTRATLSHALPWVAALGADALLGSVRRIVSRDLGVLRHADGLQRAIAALSGDAGHSDSALLALMMARAALARRESRGGHFRTDYPAPAAQAIRTLAYARDALDAARDLPREPSQDLARERRAS